MRFAFWLPFFQSVKRLFYRARRTVRRGAALFPLWAFPENNFFLQRALRVEERKRKPFLLVAILMPLILLLNGGLWWLWTWLLTTSSRELKDFSDSYELPRFLGGNLIGGVAIFTLTCCIFAAIFVCGSRASQNLRREVLGGTLEQLILLPQREEHWLWLMRAQPLALALLIYACGLPVFTLAVFTGNWHALDLLGLLLLFIAIGHWAPTWMPMQWQAKQYQGKQFDLRAWQAAVKLLQEEGKTAKGEGAVLENQRRLARLWEQMEPVSDTAPTKEGKKRWLVGASALSSSANSGNGWRTFSWIFFMQLIGPGMAILRMPGNPLGALWLNIRAALPTSITDIAPGFVVTWPLLIERFLFAPLPFFAFALPPILLYAPLWIARQIGGNLQLAAQVSPGEIFWTPRRLRARRLCGRWVFWCALLMLLGFSWTTLINDAVLAALMRGAPAPATVGWALATLWTLCLMTGVFAAGEAKEKPFKRALAEEIPLPQAWRESARLACSYFALSAAAYFLFCLLGGQPFFSAPFGQRLLPVLGTALAFLFTDYASSALEAVLPEAQRGACKALVLFWVLGLGLAALAHIAAGFYYNKPFSFVQAPYVVLSPLVTIISLLRADLNTGVPWWLGPLLQTLIGFACLLVAALQTFGVPKAQAPVEGLPNEDRLPAPLRWMIDVLTGLWDAITAFFEGCMEIVRRADEGLVQWSKRFANPILTDELQRRLRREHWPLGWVVLFLIAIGFLAQGFYFAGASIQGRYVGGVALLATLILGFSASLRLGLCFDRDRANGTLVFIFLTPLTEKEITAGKLWANLIYTGGTLLVLVPFLLIGMTLELLQGNLQMSLTGALAFGFLLSVVAYFSGLSLLCAAWARKPSQGMGLALVTGFLGQCLFLLPPGIYLILAGPVTGNAFYYITGGILFALNCVVAFFSWHGVLKLLRKQRYSDDVTSGKRTS